MDGTERATQERPRRASLPVPLPHVDPETLHVVLLTHTARRPVYRTLPYRTVSHLAPREVACEPTPSPLQPASANRCVRSPTAEMPRGRRSKHQLQRPQKGMPACPGPYANPTSRLCSIASSTVRLRQEITAISCQHDQLTRHHRRLRESWRGAPIEQQLPASNEHHRRTRLGENVDLWRWSSIIAHAHHQAEEYCQTKPVCRHGIVRTDYPPLSHSMKTEMSSSRRAAIFPNEAIPRMGHAATLLRLQRFCPVLILTTERPLRTLLHADPTSSMRRYAHSAAPSSVDKF